MLLETRFSFISVVALSLSVLTQTCAGDHAAAPENEELFQVTLVSIYSNKMMLGREAETVRISLENGDSQAASKDYQVRQKKTCSTNILCLDGKPLGSSFRVHLDALESPNEDAIGNVSVQLQREEGEIRLAFEMQQGQKKRYLRRRARVDANTFWLTRVFPKDNSANYVLRFQVEPVSR